MSDQDAPEPGEPSDLQFDHAEYQAPGAAAVACAFCHQEVPEEYHELNGKVICDTCRQAVSARFAGGSGSVRFLRAGLFGSIAAAVGFGIYYAVLQSTGFHFGLVAILVGWMVGTAVRRGAQSRGGWVYQGLAIFLTYTAVVAFPVPEIMAFIAEQDKQQAAEAAAAAQHAGVAPAPRISPMRKAVESLEVMVIAYTLPFLTWRENLIGLLIIFFALQQAWALNRKPKVKITGPYEVGELRAEAQDAGGLPGAGAPADA
jgi:hypothetical protein